MYRTEVICLIKHCYGGILSEAKKSIKQTKSVPFHARSGNEPLRVP